MLLFQKSQEKIITFFEDINESILNSFTLQQIMELIDEANACKAANSIVVLMNYKNKNFKDYDPMDQFILDY